MKVFSIKWTINKDHHGMVLREFLRIEKQISKRALAHIKFAGGSIFVNGEHATVRKVLQEGDQILVHFPPEVPSESIYMDPIPLDIIYEDEHFLVVNKPPQMATIPSHEHPRGTLANAVLYYFKQHGISSTFHAVNRLDKDTSGLVLIAKHSYAHDLMTREQKRGQVKRKYIAIVQGRLSSEQGTINAPIGRKEDSIIERVVRPDGQFAVTHYEVITQQADKAVVSVRLETGRTHQIRVHFAHIGHPLLGDDLYGGNRLEISRQALHSHICTFYHPFVERELTFTVDPPMDMKACISSK